MVGEDRACLEALGGMHGWPPSVTLVHADGLTKLYGSARERKQARED